MMITLIIFILSKICVTLCYAVVSISCTQAEMMFRAENIPTGHVSIEPDMNTYTLSAQKYYFYNTNETTPYQTFTCDGYGNFSGKLSTGNYRVIASNANPAGAVYRNMDAYETAMVYMDNLHTRSTENTGTRNTRVVALGKIYRVVLEKLDVNTNDTIRHTPTPNLLTRTLTLNFALSGELMEEVKAISGTLLGIYPSVQLSTGKTIESEIARAPELSMNYAADKQEDGWKASINLFGICNPKNGETYQSLSTITLEMTEANLQTEVELTGSLTNILENNDGTLPIDVPIQINVELELIDIGVSGNVISWSYVNSGGSEVIVSI